MRIRRHQNKSRFRVQNFFPRSWKSFFLYWIGLPGVSTVLGLTIYAVWFLPPVDQADQLSFAESTIIYGRNALDENEDPNDHILYVIHGEENREYVPLDEISPWLTKATIAIEDDRFYWHFGFDIGGLIKAVLHETIGYGSKRGGSTITQQLVKNAFLSRERSYGRKFKELLLSIKVEIAYSKDDILELYLNKIPYGHNSHGAEAAAKTFFGKSARDLTIAESAILASLPVAPSRFSPYGSNRNLLMGYQDYAGERCDSGWCRGRKDLVLQRMLELGDITEKQFQDALIEAKQIEFTRATSDIRAPHFVFWVREQIEAKYGKEFLRQGGLRIYTSLDTKLQDKVEELIALKTPQYPKEYDAQNLAMTIIDNTNGQILAYVGGRDFFDEENDGQVDVLTSYRQPGSSFKPLVFAAAFEKGFTPATVVFDVETDFGGNYRPQNFNGEFQGPVSFRQSLNESLNIPSIKAAYLAGPDEILALTRQLSIPFKGDAKQHGVALGVGVAEVQPLYHINSFQAFTGDGSYYLPSGILQVQDSKGNLLESTDFSENKREGLEPQIAAMVRHILTDEASRPTTDDFDWNNLLQLGDINNGAKTGTSNRVAENPDFDEEQPEDEEENPKFITVPGDSWTVGFTPQFTTGVWVGNNRGQPMKPGATGLALAAPLWKAITLAAHESFTEKNQPLAELYNEPKPLTPIKVNRLSGLLASDQTPTHLVTEEFFAENLVPTEIDNVIVTAEINRLTGEPADSSTPFFARATETVLSLASIRPELTNWQEPVAEWLQEHPRFVLSLGAEIDEVIDELDPNNLPSSEDDRYLSRWDTRILRDRFEREQARERDPKFSNQAPKINFVRPQNNTSLAPGEVEVRVLTESKFGVELVEYYWNDRIISQSQNTPFSTNFTLPPSAEIGTTHTIKAVAYDRMLNVGTSEVKVTIAPDTTAPEIQFLGPLALQKIVYNSDVQILVNAWDTASAVAQVEFFYDDQPIGTDTNYPFTAQFTAKGSLGRHQIKAIATDVHGNKNEKSIPIQVEREKLLIDDKPIIHQVNVYRSSAALELIFPFAENVEFTEVIVTQNGENLWYKKIASPAKYVQLQIPKTFTGEAKIELMTKLKGQNQPYVSPTKTLKW